MPNLSIRGIDEKVLSELKARALREEASVNTLVLRLIDQALGHRRGKPAPRQHHDLDGLAGAWSKDEAASFETATAPFAEVDSGLWK